MKILPREQPGTASVEPWTATIPAAGLGAEPVRLMTFLSVLAIGGSERQAILLDRELDQARFEVHLGCCVRTDDNIEAGLVARGVPVTQYKVRNLYGVGAVRQRVTLARYLRAHRIDIVHAYNFYSNVFAIPAARLAGVRAIASIRDNGECWTPWQRRVERLVCRMADAVIVNADVIKRRLVAEGLDERRIAVIHNGTLDIPAESPQRTLALRTEFGLPPNAPIVGLVARLDPIKGVEYFLDAAALVAALRPDARFLIVGGNRIDPAYAERLKQKAASLGLRDIVRFTGFREDAVDVYRLLSVSVLSSLSEGLSNTLLESMAAGIPVVATAVGGNPEAVDHGSTGFLVPPKDSTALARAICRILEDKELAASMGTAGRWRVAERFSTRAMVTATERLYLQILRRNGSRRFQP